MTPPAAPRAADARASEALNAEALTGHVFANPTLLREALTHRSAASGRARVRPGNSNERLEFLGDRVLGLLIAEWLTERYPGEPEGKLGPRLASLVSRDMLAEIGNTLGVPAHLAIGAGEAGSGLALRANVVADAMEALIGALYLDGGLPAARGFVRRVFAAAIERQNAVPQDPKTALQEWLAAHGAPPPDYVLISSDGPSHAPRFVIAVRGKGQEATGTGPSKRAAEREAAARLMALLS